MVGKTLCLWAVPIASVLAGCVDTVNVDKGDSLVLNATKRVVLVKENPEGPWDARLTRSSSRAEATHLVASRSSSVAGTAAEADQRYEYEEVGSHAGRLVCAEPSPDALSALAANGKVSVGINGQGGSLGGGMSEAAALAERTGATQILRDLGYRACEGVMNGVIGATGYNRIIGGTPPTVLGLVAVEGLTGMRSPDSVTIRSDAPATTPDAPAPKPKPGAPAPKSGASATPSDSTPDPTKNVMDKIADLIGKLVGGDEKKVKIPEVPQAPKVDPNPMPNITNAAADAVVKVVCLATAAARRVPDNNLFALCLGKSAPAGNETGGGSNDVAAGGREQHAMRTDRDRASR